MVQAVDCRHVFKPRLLDHDARPCRCGLELAPARGSSSCRKGEWEDLSSSAHPVIQNHPSHSEDSLGIQIAQCRLFFKDLTSQCRYVLCTWTPGDLAFFIGDHICVGGHLWCFICTYSFFVRVSLRTPASLRSLQKVCGLSAACYLTSWGLSNSGYWVTPFDWASLRTVADATGFQSQPPYSSGF